MEFKIIEILTSILCNWNTLFPEDDFEASVWCLRYQLIIARGHKRQGFQRYKL